MTAQNYSVIALELVSMLPDIISYFFRKQYYERVTLYSQCKRPEFPIGGARKLTQSTGISRLLGRLVSTLSDTNAYAS
jgi:hypothetical protein